MKITILTTDHKQEHDILFDLYSNHHSTPEDLLADRLPDANYLKIMGDGSLIGMTSWRWVIGTLAITERTILYPRYRGKGVGPKVSVLMEEYLRSQGAHKIMCEILSPNLRMLNIKLKQGFEIEGFQRNHDKMGVHQWVLGKVLED